MPKELQQRKTFDKTSDMSKATPKTSGCLVCGDRVKTRGLCEKHYKRFRDKKNAFATAEARAAFDATCVKEGWVLAKNAGGRPKEDSDPFGEIAEAVKEIVAKYVVTRTASERAESDPAMNESLEIAEETAAQHKAKKTAKKAATKRSQRKKSG